MRQTNNYLDPGKQRNVRYIVMDCGNINAAAMFVNLILIGFPPVVVPLLVTYYLCIKILVQI